jgi:hypothetical protein
MLWTWQLLLHIWYKLVAFYRLVWTTTKRPFRFLLGSEFFLELGLSLALWRLHRNWGETIEKGVGMLRLFLPKWFKGVYPLAFLIIMLR